MNEIIVGVLTTSFPRFAGDNAGNFIYELARHEISQGMTVKVITPHDPTHRTLDKEVMDGVQVHRFHYIWPIHWEQLCYGFGIPANLQKKPWLMLEIPALLIALTRQALSLTRECDILHAHWTLAGLAAGLAGRLTRTPVVTTMHGAEVFVRQGELLKVLIRTALGLADHVIANSHFTKERIEALTSLQRITVIPFGVDTEHFSPNNKVSDLWAKMGLPVDRPLLFALGRLVERKGFHYLVKAMPRIKQETGAYLVIGGKGPQRSHLQQLVGNLDLDADILLPGFIPDEILPALYAAADVFILPSIEDSHGDTEGLGIVLLEAMASGTAVVASRVGAIPGTLGTAGVLVPPEDELVLASSIIRLLKNADECERLARAGRRRAETSYNWDRIVDRTLAVYREVLPHQEHC